jgi:aminomethyltransferase
LEACRIEGGFIVAGWDCATELDQSPGFERSPYELGLGWLLDLNGSDFVGREALAREKEQGGRYVKRCFTTASTTKPDDGAEIWTNVDSERVKIGTVNCSSWSWGMEKMIGNASVYRQFKNQERGQLELDGNTVELDLCKGSLVTLERHKQVPAPIVKP